MKQFSMITSRQGYLCLFEDVFKTFANLLGRQPLCCSSKAKQTFLISIKRLKKRTTIMAPFKFLDSSGPRKLEPLCKLDLTWPLLLKIWQKFTRQSSFFSKMATYLNFEQKKNVWSPKILRISGLSFSVAAVLAVVAVVADGVQLPCCICS